MNFDIRKTMAFTVALILTLSIAISFVALPAVAQEEGPDVEPYPFINAIPNPVGVGEVTTLHVGSVWPIGNVDSGWEGLTVKVTRPDNTTETLGPIRTDSTGGTGVAFTPTQVGTYKLQTMFPNQQAPYAPPFGFQSSPPAYANMLESESDVLELVVTQEPSAVWPGTPLPTEYWTRPINSQIWEWHPLAGNWLGDFVSMDPPPPSQTLYYEFNADAPETAHVLWAKPITVGGLAGGPLTEPWAFEQSDAYEPKWTGSVIIGGKVFYNEFETTGSETGLEQNVVCVDLKTGEELWKKQLIDPAGNNRYLDFGQVFMWDSYNYHGVFDFIWTSGGGYWNAYETQTGRWMYSMQGVPGGRPDMFGPHGEMLVYDYDNDGWLALWNSSRVVADRGSWRPHGRIYDADDVADGYEWNVTIPADLPGSIDIIREGIIHGSNYDKYSRNGPAVANSNDPICVNWAISTKPGQEGVLLYNKTWTPPYIGHFDVQDASVEDDVFCVSGAETRQHWGFRLSTGEQIWGPTERQPFQDNWGYSSSNSWDNIVDGKYISGSYGGIVYCRDVLTGTTLWTYEIVDVLNENVQHTNWRFRPAFFADGKAYFENTEHNPFDPMHRGAPFLCLDLETGERVFEIDFRGSEWSSTPIIGDSTIVMFNVYDLQLYAMGKGPSKTTVSAGPKVSVLGDIVLVEGMVTDISPGTEKYALRARFPDGVPAVADESMTPWMRYVYNQFARPFDAVGVEVIVEVFDPNMNYYEVGRATSDASGNYVLEFEPEVPGLYTVVARFAGSKSYYGSFAETYLRVNEAPPPEATPEPVTMPPVDMYILYATVAIIVAIVIFGILLLRKK